MTLTPEVTQKLMELAEFIKQNDGKVFVMPHTQKLLDKLNLTVDDVFPPEKPTESKSNVD